MKRSFLFLPLMAVALVALTMAGTTYGQQSLDIGGSTFAQGLQAGSVDVSMTTTDDTEGFVLAVGYDTTKISILDFAVSAAVLAAPAELVSAEIFDAAGGATLGVVLDSGTPFDGQVIAAGTTMIANISIMPDLVVAVDEFVPIAFVDGTFNTPVLNNIIVQGGLSLGAGTIALNDGGIELRVPPPDSLYMVDANVPPGGTGSLEIMLDLSSGDVQGFVLAIENAVGPELTSIDIVGTATQAAGAEFVVPNVVSTEGGTLGVVLDFSAPFENKVIAIGAGLHLANFNYRCPNPPTEPDPEICTPVTFVDGVLGSPALDNVIVVAGLSLNPTLIGGEICCKPVPAQDTEFNVGALDGDGNVVPVVGAPGETVELCFFWKDPSDNISGFQLAVCYDCQLEFVDGTFSIEGTILEAVGAEYVNYNIGDCEFVAGILLDALPPFDGQTVPQTSDLLTIGCIDVELPDDPSKCNTCLDVWFCDGAMAGGNVPIENIVVANKTVSIQNFLQKPGLVCIESELEFIRGDCNFDEKVDLADSASILVHQFQGFVVNCEDACDVNDDGNINLADSVYILNWMFKAGPAPEMPYPDQGTDDTVDDPSGLWDELDCVNGWDKCLNPGTP